MAISSTCRRRRIALCTVANYLQLVFVTAWQLTAATHRCNFLFCRPATRTQFSSVTKPKPTLFATRKQINAYNVWPHANTPCMRVFSSIILVSCPTATSLVFIPQPLVRRPFDTTLHTQHHATSTPSSEDTLLFVGRRLRAHLTLDIAASVKRILIHVTCNDNIPRESQ